MSINYIIVSYPGKTKSRIKEPYSEEILDLHMKYLCILLRKKRELGIKLLIEQITLVYTDPKPEDYQNYYDIPKWQKMFEGLVKFQVLEYFGQNLHYSYDKFLLAINHFRDIPYNILIEDDYYIDPSNPTFDLELLDIYKKSFPNNFGYLCTYAPKNDKGQRTFPSIANGFLSTFSVVVRRPEKDGTAPKTQLERFYAEQDFCQIAFGNIFMPFLEDISDEYYLPFWTGVNGELQDFTTAKPSKKMFMPIQLCEEIRERIVPIGTERVNDDLKKISDLRMEMEKNVRILLINQEFLRLYSGVPN